MDKPSDDRFYMTEDIIKIEDSNNPSDQFQNVLESIINELEKDTTNLYTEPKVFSYFYSLFDSFKIVNDETKLKLLESFSNIFEKFTKDLEEFTELNSNDQQKQNNIMRNTMKVYIFFCNWIIEAVLEHFKTRIKDIKKGRRKVKGAMGEDKKKTKKTKKTKASMDVDNPPENESAFNEEEVNEKLGDILRSFKTISDSNIKNLFKNKFIDDDAITNIIKSCFDILEIFMEIKKNNYKQTVFDDLQLLLTKFHANTNIQLILLKLTAKIVHLIYSQETLVQSLSEFIVQAINGDLSLNKMAVDVIHEVSKTVFEDQTMDSQGIKNVAKLLTFLSEQSPKVMYNNISILLPLFDCESYIIRNSILEIIGNIILKVLCNLDDVDDLNTKKNYMKTKENFVDILFERIYDKSSYSRAKVLQVFEKLCENNCISVPSYLRLLQEASGRLRDEKSIVRKKAIALIRRIIGVYSVIFKCKTFLSYKEVEDNIKETEKKIDEMESKLRSSDHSEKKDDSKDKPNGDGADGANPNPDVPPMADGSNANNLSPIKKDDSDGPQVMDIDDGNKDPNKDPNFNTPSKGQQPKKDPKSPQSPGNDLSVEEKAKILEEIEKQQMVIEYFKNYKEVLESIDSIVPLIGLLLNSKTTGDVQECIDLFIVLHKLRIPSSFQGVKKMLTLIIKPEESIKKKVIEAYRLIYFSDDYSLDIQAAYLVELCSSLDHSEIECLKELLKHYIKDKLIDMDIFKEVWKILIKIPDNEIENMRAFSADELNEKIQQMEIEGLSALKIINMSSEFDENILTNNADLYLKNVLNHLKKNSFSWLVIKESLFGIQKIHKYKTDLCETCLIKIARALFRGYGILDNDWFLVVKELIATIFEIMKQPEKFCEFLIIKLSKPFFIKGDEEVDNETHKRFATQNFMSQFPSNMEMDSQLPNPALNGTNQDPNNPLNQPMTPVKLAQLLFLIGEISLKMIIYSEHLEGVLKDKLKESNDNDKSAGKSGSKGKGKSGSKDKDKDDLIEMAGGKEADLERDLKLLRVCIEDQILTQNLISRYVPLIVNVSQMVLKVSNEELKKNILLYKCAILSLCKLMCCNQKFCEEHLPFMFDVLDCDTLEENVKLNVCIAFGDFINRFPNILQNNINKFFKGLQSKNEGLRRYTMIVISHLVLSDLLKLKGEIVDICLLLETDDPKLKDLITLFLNEINLKGTNTIYNIIPKALARLNNEYKNLSYESYQKVILTLFKYIEKDKQTEGLIEKLLNKIKESNDLREWQTMTFCLGVLNYNNEKLILKFIEEYTAIKEKQDNDKIVLENLATIFYKMKKANNLQPNTKTVIQEAEEKILKGEKYVVNKNVIKKTKRKKGGGSSSSGSDSMSDSASVSGEGSEDDSGSVSGVSKKSKASRGRGKGKGKGKGRGRKKKKPIEVIDEEPDEEDKDI
ncbi:MAG: hypothetical protein MJ252_10285 [archaeon]|nr:hypothetical protein [archaeon]